MSSWIRNVSIIFNCCFYPYWFVALITEISMQVSKVTTFEFILQLNIPVMLNTGEMGHWQLGTAQFFPFPNWIAKEIINNNLNPWNFHALIGNNHQRLKINVTFLMFYKVHPKSIETETVFTKTEMKNEWNVSFLLSTRYIKKVSMLKMYLPKKKKRNEQQTK